VIAWAAVIFTLSSNPDPYRALPEGWPDGVFELIGSILHFFEYSLLAFLLARALVWRGTVTLQLLWTAFVLSAFYALSDEIHQVFVPGRTFQLLDLGLDFTGSLAGLWLYVLVRKRGWDTFWVSSSSAEG
jgi:VanZ family protein